MTTDSERLAILEATVRLLVAREAEAERLIDGVDRLGDETSALTAVLAGLDDATRRIGTLEATTVNDEEVAATVDAAAKLERHRARRRILGIGLTVAILGLLAGAGFAMNKRAVDDARKADLVACMQRLERLDTTLDLYRALADSEQTIAASAPRLATEFERRATGYARAIEQLEAERPDCQRLYGPKGNE